MHCIYMNDTKNDVFKHNIWLYNGEQVIFKITGELRERTFKIYFKQIGQKGGTFIFLFY